MKMLQKTLAVIAAITLSLCTLVHAQQTKSMQPMSDTAFLRKNIKDNLMEIELSDMARDKGDAPVKKIARQMVSDHSVILADLRKIAGKKDMKDVFSNGPQAGNNVAATGTPDTTTEANGTGITGAKVAGSAATTTGTTATNTGMDNSGSGVGTSMARGTTSPTGAGMNHDNAMNSMPDLASATGEQFNKMWVMQMTKMHKAKLAELQMASKQIQDPELLDAVNKAIPKITMHLDMLNKINSGSSGSGTMPQ